LVISFLVKRQKQFLGIGHKRQKIVAVVALRPQATGKIVAVAAVAEFCGTLAYFLFSCFSFSFSFSFSF
jgi:hypothetical protein